MALTLGKLISGVPNTRVVCNPFYYQRNFSLVSFILKRPGCCVGMSFVDSFPIHATLDWKWANVATHRGVSLNLADLSCCSRSLSSWNRSYGVPVKHHLAPKLQSFAANVHNPRQSLMSASATSDDSQSTTQADAASVLQSNESMAEFDEEISEDALHALREFDMVNEDLEGENQRIADVARTGRRSKKMCYYFTQGLCTLRLIEHSLGAGVLVIQDHPRDALIQPSLSFLQFNGCYRTWLTICTLFLEVLSNCVLAQHSLPKSNRNSNVLR